MQGGETESFRGPSAGKGFGFVKLGEYCSTSLQQLVNHLAIATVGEYFSYCGQKDEVKHLVDELSREEPGKVSVHVNVEYYADGDFGLHRLQILSKKFIPSSEELDSEGAASVSDRFSQLRRLFWSVFKKTS